MARPPSRTPLQVFLNGRLVGRLHKQASGAIDFAYDDTWLRWEHTFPISLSLPLRESRYLGDRVTAVFDNLLPDNTEIRRRLAERTGAEGDDAFSLLASIGRDCVGALQFLPDGAEPDPAGQVDGKRVTDKRIATLIADLSRNPLGISETDEGFRISIAGAQEKTALLFWKKRWHIPHGSSATTHILKPAIGLLGNGIDLTRSVENEHFCMLLAAAFGLPAARTEILSFGTTRVLAVERFDRHWTRDGRLLRVPQEDLCQALSVPPTRKYQSEGGPGIKEVLEFLKASDDPEHDRRLFIKSQMLFWLLGATDGHAKNFSIFLHPGGGFRLTPIYDVMSLQPTFAAGQVKRNRMKLAMSVGRQRHYVLATIVPRHFIQSAAQAGMPRASVEAVMDELVNRAADAIESARAQLPPKFPRHIANPIVDALSTRLSLLRDGPRD